MFPIQNQPFLYVAATLQPLPYYSLWDCNFSMQNCLNIHIYHYFRSSSQSAHYSKNNWQYVGYSYSLEDCTRLFRSEKVSSVWSVWPHVRDAAGNGGHCYRNYALSDMHLLFHWTCGPKRKKIDQQRMYDRLPGVLEVMEKKKNWQVKVVSRSVPHSGIPSHWRRRHPIDYMV